jgi:HEAT repeat protein
LLESSTAALHDNSIFPRLSQREQNTGIIVMKRSFTRLGRLAVLLAVLPPAGLARAGGSANVVPQRKLLELVRQLGDSDFQARERASKELFQIGLPAKQALLEGSKDADLEVRRRCRDLLPEILEADRQTRLTAFIADKEGKQHHDLPGWQRYRKIAGSDPAARQFFVEIQQADLGFLTDVERTLETAREPATAETAKPDQPRPGATNRAGDLCSARCQELFQKLYGRPAVGSRQVNLAEIAPLLLVLSDADVRMPEQQRYFVFNLLYQQTSQNLLRNASATPFKKIVLAWMERQADDEAGLQLVFNLVNQLEIKEGLDLALRTIRDKKLKGMMLASALTTVGKLGDREQLPLLERYLADQTVIGNFNLGTVRGTTQVRDAALAMLVRVTKQSHKDYGFAISQYNNEHLMSYANFLGFSGDELRDRALSKWKQWKAVQKK